MKMRDSDWPASTSPHIIDWSMTARGEIGAPIFDLHVILVSAWIDSRQHITRYRSQIIFPEKIPLNSTSLAWEAVPNALYEINVNLIVAFIAKQIHHKSNPFINSAGYCFSEHKIL